MEGIDLEMWQELLEELRDVGVVKNVCSDVTHILFHTLDQDGGGSIEREEFRAMLSIIEVRIRELSADPPYFGTGPVNRRVHQQDPRQRPGRRPPLASRIAASSCATAATRMRTSTPRPSWLRSGQRAVSTFSPPPTHSTPVATPLRFPPSRCERRAHSLHSLCTQDEVHSLVPASTMRSSSEVRDRLTRLTGA